MCLYLVRLILLYRLTWKCFPECTVCSDLIVGTSPFQCAVCCQSRSVMQVAPCGHQALCRLCFVRNIQEAVASRDLPLKCLICGTKIIRVKNNARGPGSGNEHPVHVGLGAIRSSRPPRSVSGYSLCASSEAEAEAAAGQKLPGGSNSRHPSLAQSASSYSMSSGTTLHNATFILHSLQKFLLAQTKLKNESKCVLK